MTNRSVSRAVLGILALMTLGTPPDARTQQTTSGTIAMTGSGSAGYSDRVCSFSTSATANVTANFAAMTLAVSISANYAVQPNPYGCVSYSASWSGIVIPLSQSGNSFSGTVTSNFACSSCQSGEQSLQVSAQLVNKPSTSGPSTLDVTLSFTAQYQLYDPTLGAGFNNNSASGVGTLVGPELQITPSSFPNGNGGRAYSQALSATGGTQPYTWSLVSGQLPKGLSLSDNTVTGTPTAPGFYNFTVRVTDSGGSTAQRPFSIEVDCTTMLPATWSQATPPWGSQTYNNYNPKGAACVLGDATTNCSIQRLGCSLTSLAMALDFAGVTTVNGFPFNPGSLNAFMEAPNDLFDSMHNVKWDSTTRALLPGKRFISERSTNTQTIDGAICSGFPEIAGIDLDSTGKPTHYVVVTEVQGNPQRNNYQIADPGDSTNTALDPSDFVTRGHIEDPAGDISGLDIYVGTPTTLLVTDSSQNQTGFDNTTNTAVEQIPRSVYFVDSLRDDVTLAPPGTWSHSVLMFQPTIGMYTIALTGQHLGSYTLQVDAFFADGTAQPEVTIPGIAAAGSTSTYQIQYSSLPATASTVTLMATYQSTLADITNSLALGLIDNAGIANALTSKIQAAQSAAGSGQNQTAINVLGAFENQVSAQAGQHVFGVALQVLQRDAASLISQTP